jgi:WD40 repeat protein
MCLWDAYTGKTIKAVSPDDGDVVRAALPPDAQLAALSVFNGEVRVYSLVSGEELWSQTTLRDKFAFSPDGCFLATDCLLRGGLGINIYDAKIGRHLFKLTGHDAPILRLTFAPDGLLYSCDARGVIRAWNIEHRRQQWCFSTLAWASDNRCFQEAPENVDPRAAAAGRRHPIAVRFF